MRKINSLQSKCGYDLLYKIIYVSRSRDIALKSKDGTFGFMKYDYYIDIGIALDYEVFDFVSTGDNGSIYKRVVFTYIFPTKIYNLAFGDVLENGEIDDYSISDNKDMIKILSTISRIIKLFLNKYPDRKVFFSGSTPERTRLYRMAIGNNLEELSEIYNISAILENGDIVEFTNNLPCAAFLIGNKS